MILGSTMQYGVFNHYGLGVYDVGRLVYWY